MATRQIFLASINTPGNLAGYRALFRPRRVNQATENLGDHPWAVAGTLKNLYVKIATAPGGVASRTYAVRKNGVDTALSVTITGAATSNSNQSDTVTVAVGDTLTLHDTVGGSPANYGGLDFTLEFESDDNQSGYASNCDVNLSSSADRFNGPFAGVQSWDATEANRSNIVAAAGNITKAYYKLDGAPGAGNDYTFTLRKNGVDQDGAGGTPDTRVVISGNAATTGNASFTLSVSPGDVVSIKATPNSSPTLRKASYAIAFTPTTAGESQFCGADVGGTPSATLTNYLIPTGITSNDNNWQATEPAWPHGGLSTFSLYDFRVTFDVAPGVGKSRGVDLRKNSASTGPTPNVTISDAATSADDGTNSMSLATGDTLSLRTVPSGTPTAPGNVKWAAVMYSVTTVTFTGSGGVTFSKPTLAGVGKKHWFGPGAITFSKPSLAGAGIVHRAGVGDITFGKPTLDGTGTVVNGPIAGTGDITFGPPTLAGAGVVHRAGVGSITFGPPTLTGAGIVVLPPSDVAVFQVPVEVAEQDDQTKALVYQVPVETAIQDGGTKVRVYQVAVEAAFGFVQCEPETPPGAFEFPPCIDWASQALEGGEDLLDPIAPMEECTDWPSQALSEGEDTLAAVADRWSECDTQ